MKIPSWKSLPFSSHVIPASQSQNPSASFYQHLHGTRQFIKITKHIQTPTPQKPGIFHQSAPFNWLVAHFDLQTYTKKKSQKTGQLNVLAPLKSIAARFGASMSVENAWSPVALIRRFAPWASTCWMWEWGHYWSVTELMLAICVYIIYIGRTQRNSGSYDCMHGSYTIFHSDVIRFFRRSWNIEVSHFQTVFFF